MGFCKQWSGKMWNPRGNRPVSFFMVRQTVEDSGKQWPWGHTGLHRRSESSPVGCFCSDPCFQLPSQRNGSHPDCSCTAWLEAGFSRCGMVFGIPKSKGFLFTKFLCASRWDNKTQFCLLVALPQDTFPCLSDCPFQRLSIATQMTGLGRIKSFWLCVCSAEQCKRSLACWIQSS